MARASTRSLNNDAQRPKGIDRYLLRCAAWLKRHDKWSHVLIVGILLGVVTGALLLIGVDLGPAFYGVDLGAAIIAVLIPSVLLAAVIHHERKMILDVVENAPASGMPIMVQMLRAELEDVTAQLVEVTENGVVLANDKAEGWISERLFRATEGIYTGVAKAVPSEYLTLHRAFLGAHGRYAKRPSYRYLLATEADLRADAINHPEEYRDLVNWHAEHDVELQRCDPETAIELASSLGSDTEVCFWEQELALRWVPQPDEEVLVRCFFVGTHTFSAAQEYVRQITGVDFPEFK
jgi:hypothetical protein